LTRATRGVIFGVLAYGCWGMLPLYWPLLEPANPLEILAFRIVCSFISIAVFLTVRRQLSHMRRLDRATLLRLAVAGLIIALNWGVYIWAVNNKHVLETSLGYFMNPLITIALGVVILRERLRSAQWVAVALGAVAVVALSINYGQPPWLALFIAVSFASYGFIKNRIRAGAPEGVLVEAAATTVPAVVVLAVLAIDSGATWVGHDATSGHLLLLASTGPVTVIPLLFFAGAAKRLPLSSLGLLQYLAPVLQFVIGALALHEPLPAARLGGFALVWAALAILTVDAFRHRRAVPSVVAAPETIDVGEPRDAALAGTSS
jgi:chloramphenicol-sensitive protein RarD